MEEETRLAGLIQVGRQPTASIEEQDSSRQARDELARANLRFVVYISKRYIGLSHIQGLEQLDLIQEGNLGLLLAAESFQSGHGKFSTFAASWIRGKINRALPGQGRVIQISRRTHAKLNRLRKEEDWFLAEMGCAPTLDELAAVLEIDIESLIELRLAEQEVVALDESVEGREEELVYREIDLIEDPESADRAERAVDRPWLDWLLEGLSERSRRILEWRYFLGMTLEEVGTRENLSRERVRQIENVALQELRQRGTRIAP